MSILRIPYANKVTIGVGILLLSTRPVIACDQLSMLSPDWVSSRVNLGQYNENQIPSLGVGFR
jgi:hypothetical protein